MNTWNTWKTAGVTLANCIWGTAGSSDKKIAPNSLMILYYNNIIIYTLLNRNKDREQLNPPQQWRGEQSFPWICVAQMCWFKRKICTKKGNSWMLQFYRMPYQQGNEPRAAKPKHICRSQMWQRQVKRQQEESENLSLLCLFMQRALLSLSDTSNIKMSVWATVFISNTLLWKLRNIIIY